MKPERKKLNDFCEMKKLKHSILKPSFKGLFTSTIELMTKSVKQISYTTKKWFSWNDWTSKQFFKIWPVIWRISWDISVNTRCIRFL